MSLYRADAAPAREEKLSAATAGILLVSQASTMASPALEEAPADASRRLWREDEDARERQQREVELAIARTYREALQAAVLGSHAERDQAQSAYGRAQQRVQKAAYTLSASRVEQARLRSEASYQAARVRDLDGEIASLTTRLQTAITALEALRREDAARMESKASREQEAEARETMRAAEARREYLAKREAARMEKAYPFRLDEEEIQKSEQENADLLVPLSWETARTEAARASAERAQRLQAADDAVVSARLALEAAVGARQDAAQRSEDAAARAGELAAQEDARVQELSLAREDGRYVQERMLNAQDRVSRESRDLAAAMADEAAKERRLKLLDADRALAGGAAFSAWSGADSGSQLLMPVSYAWRAGRSAFSVETGYFRAEGNGEHARGLAAPVLSWQRDRPLPAGTFSYGVRLALPSDEAHPLAAPPVGAGLSPQALWHGWEVTPSVRLTRPLGAGRTLEGALSYTWRAPYDVTWGGLGTVRYAPSDAWQAELAYRSVQGARQSMLRLAYAGEAGGTFGALSYAPGARCVLEWRQSRRVNARNEWQNYASLGYNGAGSGYWQGTSGVSMAAGVGWRHQVDARSHIALDVGAARATDSGIDPVIARAWGERTRWHVGIAYDRALSDRDRLDVRVERYELHDDTAGRYHGVTASVFLKKVF